MALAQELMLLAELIFTEIKKKAWGSAPCPRRDRWVRYRDDYGYIR